MDVGTEPDVVGEIPANVVRIVVDHYVVAVPEPIVTVGDIEGGNAEIESAEPEPAGTAADQAPAMAGAEASFEVSMFPGMLEMEACVVASLFVPYPLAVAMNMRGLRMAFAIAERLLGGTLVRCLMRLTVIGWWTVAGNVAPTDVVAPVISVVSMLRPQWQGKNK